MMFADEEHATPGAGREGRMDVAWRMQTACALTVSPLRASSPARPSTATPSSPTSICRGHPTEWPSGCLSALEEPQHRLRDRARPILCQTSVRSIFGPSQQAHCASKVPRFGNKPFPAATCVPSDTVLLYRIDHIEYYLPPSRGLLG